MGCAATEKRKFRAATGTHRAPAPSITNTPSGSDNTPNPPPQPRVLPSPAPPPPPAATRATGSTVIPSFSIGSPKTRRTVIAASIWAIALPALGLD
jgi:hypothetical protein